MGKPRSIELSRKVFGSLLNLYPAAHRRDYGTAMLQVFTEQSRGAYAQKGVFGVILLWLRTLPDVGYSSLLEHLTAPGAAWGLMEPVPGAPLPWKGVLLVLLPGLVYLVSQIAQLTGQAWYMTVYYRAAFFLILPVLVVWAITRRFPLWGLIPLGLLFNLCQEIGYDLIVLHPGVFSTNPLLNLIFQAALQFQQDLFIPAALAGMLILLLGWLYLRRQKPSRSFWLMLGFYLLVLAVQLGREFWFSAQYISPEFYSPQEMQSILRNSIAWVLYNSSALLLMVFVGSLFTRRHGFFAMLVPLGYILPTVVVGIGLDYNSGSRPSLALVLASLAVLAYRVILSLVAPVWMSRSATQAGKKRVLLIVIACALGIHTIMQFYPAPFTYQAQGAELVEKIISVALSELQTISALLLALAMYQGALPAEPAPQHPALAYSQTPLEES